VELQQPAELRGRVGVVVDPKVDPAVVRPADAALLAPDEQRGRLAAPTVAAGLVPSPERGDEPARKGPWVVSYADIMASTTSGPARMFPWAATPGATRPPAQGMQLAPVQVADRPVASTIPAWRWAAIESAAVSAASTVSASSPAARRSSPSGP
jgi:hypothetical protein